MPKGVEAHSIFGRKHHERFLLQLCTKYFDLNSLENIL